MVGCIGNIGKTAITDVELSASNQQINSIVCSPDYDNLFIYYLLTNLSDFLKSLAGKVTIPILNKSNFERITIFVPKDLDEQKRISSILLALDNKIQAEARKQKSFEIVFESLLMNIMTGTLRIVP